LKNYKSIEKIISPPPYHWVGNGFKVHNFLPRAIDSNTRMSPFFLLDYNAKMHYPPSPGDKRGVGVHPHRGLETITIAYRGKIAHHDSEGNGGIIGEGDVQWMTAGKAILHKEYHEESYVEQGGDFQMVQLWVNLPAKDKMTAPKYQEIPHSMMGKYELKDNMGHIHVIAGHYKDVSGPANTFTPINLYNAYLTKGAKAEFSFEKTYNTAILIIEGEINVNNSIKAPCDTFVLFANDGTDICIEALGNSVVLVMSGEPINEDIFPYGPFLMNTEEEIQEAFNDYHNGIFGYLED